MYAVIVTFDVKKEFILQFQSLILKQAKNSVNKESGCHYFDVVKDESNDNIFYLYELYTDPAAFKVHLESTHFKEFNQKVSPMITSKKIYTGHKI